MILKFGSAENGDENWSENENENPQKPAGLHNQNTSNSEALKASPRASSRRSQLPRHPVKPLSRGRVPTCPRTSHGAKQEEK